MTGISPQFQRQDERDTTMRDLVAVVFKRKWLILGIVVGVSAVVGWRTFTAPETYSADARVMIKRQGARASELDRVPRHLPWSEVVESEIELMQSAPVFERARQKLLEPTEHFPEGIQMGLFALGKAIKVGVMGESTVLFIQGTADAPRKAVAITNAVAEAYVEVHTEMFRLPETGDFLRARADSTMRELKRFQEERAGLQTTIGVTEVADQELALIRLREGLRRVAVDVEQKIARMESELGDAQAFLDDGGESIPFVFTLGTVQGNSLVKTLDELQEVRSNLQSLEQKYTDQHPQVMQAKNDITRLESVAKQGMLQAIALKQNELRAARAEAEAVEREMRDATAKLAALPQIRSDINILNAKIRDLETQHKLLAEEAITAEVLSKSFDDYSVVIVSRALRGEANSGADMVRVALAPLLSLLLALGLAFYLENMDHTVSSRDDLERHFEIPVLASFPDAEIAGAAEDEPEPGTTRRIPFRGASGG